MLLVYIVGCPGKTIVHDVGLSDNFFLSWEVCATRPATHSTVVNSRLLSRLDVDSFRSAVSISRLCQPNTWPLDIDHTTALKDSEMNILLDRLLPLRLVVRRQRTSAPYFDNECRDAKLLNNLHVRLSPVASRQSLGSRVH